MRLDDPHGEHAQAVAEAAKVGPLTRDRSHAYLLAVLDAEQARREWAVAELAAIQHAGATARFKRLWKPPAQPVPVGGMTIDVQTVVGVERDGEWQQLPMVELTVAEIKTVVEHRKSSRDRATKELVALRRVDAFATKHAQSTDVTLAEVLKAAGADLLDVMVGAA